MRVPKDVQQIKISRNEHGLWNCELKIEGGTMNYILGVGRRWNSALHNALKNLRRKP